MLGGAEEASYPGCVVILSMGRRLGLGECCESLGAEAACEGPPSKRMKDSAACCCMNMKGTVAFVKPVATSSTSADVSSWALRNICEGT